MFNLDGHSLADRSLTSFVLKTDLNEVRRHLVECKRDRKTHSVNMTLVHPKRNHRIPVEMYTRSSYGLGGKRRGYWALIFRKDGISHNGNGTALQELPEDRLRAPARVNG